MRLQIPLKYYEFLIHITGKICFFVSQSPLQQGKCSMRSAIVNNFFWYSVTLVWNVAKTHYRNILKHPILSIIPCWVFNPLSAKLTKWPNTLKQFVGNLLTNCLSVFGHFVGLAFKELIVSCLVISLSWKFLKNSSSTEKILHCVIIYKLQVPNR